MNVFRLAAPVLIAAGVAACGAPMKFQGTMSGAYEVPPTASRGTGTIAATVFPTTKAMTYTVEYADLTGPATAAHFHGPAVPGANAPVILPAASPASPIKGSATLTDAQLADFAAGRWYFNVHTPANPGGEIRGQVLRVQ